MTFRICLFILLSSVFGGTAHAHGGHLGELAGHSHWVGVAALAGAALVAGAAAWATRRKDRQDEQEEETATAEDGERPVEA